MKCYLILFVVILLTVFIVCLLSNKKERYSYLASLYDSSQGGFYTEYNDVCLDNANRHCMMKSGVEGVCLLNGVCGVPIY